MSDCSHIARYSGLRRKPATPKESRDVVRPSETTSRSKAPPAPRPERSHRRIPHRRHSPEPKTSCQNGSALKAEAATKIISQKTAFDRNYSGLETSFRPNTTLVGVSQPSWNRSRRCQRRRQSGGTGPASSTSRSAIVRLNTHDSFGTSPDKAGRIPSSACYRWPGNVRPIACSTSSGTGFSTILNLSVADLALRSVGVIV